jgi:predicted Zn-dependent protease
LRGGLLVLAVAACAWFVLGIRQAQETDQAAAIVAQRPTAPAAKLREAASLLRSAGFLNPGVQVDILRGQLAILQQRPRLAVQILRGATRSEPMNLEAWIWLAGASLIDPPQAKIALAHIHALDPRAR